MDKLTSQLGQERESGALRPPLSDRLPGSSNSAIAIQVPAISSQKKLSVISSFELGGAVSETYEGGYVRSCVFLSPYFQVPRLFNRQEEGEKMVAVLGDWLFVGLETSMEKAASLIGRSTKLNGHFCEIVAAMARESGKHYVVCRLFRSTVMDAGLVSAARRGGNPRIRYANPKELSGKERKGAAIAVMGAIGALHRKGLLLGRFRTRSVAFYDGFSKARFLDPRFLCEAGDSGTGEAMLCLAVLRAAGLIEAMDSIELSNCYLSAAGTSNATAYFSDRLRVDGETAAKCRELFGKGGQKAGIPELLCSKSEARFLPIARMLGMN